jgi:phosphoglycerate dehydrogenase-like enzyme
MAASDYVVMATPYTAATDKLIGAAAIAAMKPTGVLVNVGRGKCIDEEALIEGVRVGARARACVCMLRWGGTTPRNT